MSEKFSFCILAFNHEDYIKEHLNSILFQVVNYGQNIEIDLIITDDFSSDKTVDLIDDFININSSYFSSISFIKNKINKGTAKCVLILESYLKTNAFKITAGDDVYGPHNIFEFYSSNYDGNLLSGYPIRLINGKLKFNQFELFNFIASDVIYKNSKLVDRLSSFSLANAPNCFYPRFLLADSFVKKNLEKFDVIEDASLQFAGAIRFPEIKLKTFYKPIVFYRRTDNSAYLTAPHRFKKDQLRLIDLMLCYYKSNGNLYSIIKLYKRKWLFNIKNKYIRWVFSIDGYRYSWNIIMNIIPILNVYKKLSNDVSNYQSYYEKDIKISK